MSLVIVYRALRHCEEFIQRYNRAEDTICIPHNEALPHRGPSSNVGKAVEDCMRAIIGVLLNLTNDNGMGFLYFDQIGCIFFL